MINFANAKIVKTPFPYLVIDNALNEEDFERITKEIPSKEFIEGVKQQYSDNGYGKRYDISSRQSDFYDMIEKSPTWKKLYDYLYSKEFLNEVDKVFGDEVSRMGGLFQTRKLRLVPGRYNAHTYKEPGIFRVRKIGRKLKEVMKNNVFVEAGLAIGNEGYWREAHVDNRNRIASMLIYFNGREDFDGGDLVLYKSKKERPLESYGKKLADEEAEAFETVEPKKNRVAMFLCSNNSFHGVVPVKEKNAPRKFSYIGITSISSHIWKVD